MRIPLAESDLGNVSKITIGISEHLSKEKYPNGTITFVNFKKLYNTHSVKAEGLRKLTLEELDKVPLFKFNIPIF